MLRTTRLEEEGAERVTAEPRVGSGEAVLLIDPQNDFCPGGSLPVAGGDRVMPVLNRWVEAAEAEGRPVFVSRDWHPAQTTHFTSGGGVWPPHCIVDTPGAAFHPDLRLPAGATVVSKGMGAEEDAYSAFQARDAEGRGLAQTLRARGVRHLYVMGLATDYCVRSSVLDALADGYEVTVVRDGVRAVDVQPGDGDRALAEMEAAGAKLR